MLCVILSAPILSLPSLWLINWILFPARSLRQRLAVKPVRWDAPLAGSARALGLATDVHYGVRSGVRCKRRALPIVLPQSWAGADSCHWKVGIRSGESSSSMVTPAHSEYTILYGDVLADLRPLLSMNA